MALEWSRCHGGSVETYEAFFSPAFGQAFKLGVNRLRPGGSWRVIWPPRVDEMFETRDEAQRASEAALLALLESELAAARLALSCSQPRS